MFFLWGLIVGAILGGAYFGLRFDPASPNATLAEAVLVVVQFAGMVGALELLIFLYRPHVRQSKLLSSRHKSIVLAVFVLFVICTGRLIIALLLP